SVIFSLLTWAVSNPMMILAAIGIWLATGWISDVKGWIDRRDTAAQYQRVVADRDAVALNKDRELQKALKEQDDARTELQGLQAQVDEAEKAHVAQAGPDCVWSDADAKLLNIAKPKRN